MKKHNLPNGGGPTTPRVPRRVKVRISAEMRVEKERVVMVVNGAEVLSVTWEELEIAREKAKQL